MAFGIFAIMCPGCGTPLENDDDGSSTERSPADDVPADVPEDVLVCGGCASAFVVRFGHALAVARPTDRGVL
jgi:hypothetical protein